MKGALAAALVAAARAREDKLAGDLVVACVIDEELASAGTERLLALRAAEAAVVCEPTDERICVAHKGFVGFEIETRGRAAHGSRPDLGVDAIAAMGPVLTGLRQLADALGDRSGHRLLGPGSIHASLIEGGQEYSSYPERCLLSGERRTVPGESLDEIEQELRGLADQSGAEVRVTMSRSPFEVDPASGVATAACPLHPEAPSTGSRSGLTPRSWPKLAFPPSSLGRPGREHTRPRNGSSSQASNGARVSTRSSPERSAAAGATAAPALQTSSAERCSSRSAQRPRAPFGRAGARRPNAVDGVRPGF